MIDVAAELTRRELDTVLVGFGVTNQAVARALLRAGHRAVVVDDHPVDRLRAVAHDIGVSLIEGPETSELSDLVERADAVFPAPGLPESHPAFDLAGEHGVAVAGELDLARAWDDRPIAAVTGTNGKTTVVDLTVTALRESGIRAMAAGNTDVPLVEAIDDASIDVFVVEASSFRLARAQAFAPRVATWLNFAPNHLDVHRDLQGYERAKAAIWTHLPDDAVAVANAADPVVMSHLPSDRQVVTFGAHGDWRRDGDDLIGPSGRLAAVEDLWRTLPHDVEDALAAAATASQIGADGDGLVRALRGFSPPGHRVEAVGVVGGIEFYDDSKATTPHATVAAVRGFREVVLIAGGRNKGIDLAPLSEASDRIRAVIAIGEAAAEVVAVFESLRPVEVAVDMDDAVRRARRRAATGVPVLLSPGCASFDWYRDYAERGDDFARVVAAHAEMIGGSR